MSKRKWIVVSAVLLSFTIVLTVVLVLVRNETEECKDCTTFTPFNSSSDGFATTYDVTEAPGTESAPMLVMLDAMYQLLTSEEDYDHSNYEELRACMNTFDPNLVQSQDSAWQGMIDYWVSNGTPEDPWGGYQTHYFETNVTNTEFLNMTIYEPCNYASNMAMYRVVTEICSRKTLGPPFSLPEDYISSFGTSFSVLAFGSSFMHGSHTWLGHLLDNAPIGVVSYLIHQGSVSPLVNASSIITDFARSPRNQTALEIANDFVDIYSYLPVEEWYDRTMSLDIPDYYYTFAAITTTALELSFNKENMTETVVKKLAEAFNVPDSLTNFILDDYLPEFRSLTDQVELNPKERLEFAGNFVSSLIKLIYAFLWQEQRLTSDPIFLDPAINELGWQLLPEVNDLANSLNSFTFHDAEFQTGSETYPGDFWCNPVYPHAKWHLESALGLLDLAYLGDEIHRLLEKHV